ncbi:helix-turn-helix domain-containing protein [Brevundimonas goettingensis]|uniref:Helix-turn-helix domain-containing protein n=1 Tax=Brevundimonas goettingensis TaxID=2774190 RepID=A0A975BZ82_9CAUL|nr:helix-turn-helix transcriptional regulator [Brevundimonas goettingensis]QTC90708.1 helix-turn-helix domain-containing protein [Brevundimonas goettingensis]
MPRFEQDSDVRALGEALAALRRERGLSQAEAGARLDMTSQGWGLYEAGKRPGLFRPDVQRRLTAALDASPEDLALTAARITADAPATPPAKGVESGGRGWSGAPSAPRVATERLQLSNDDLAPWAASGVVLEFDPGRWPRRDQGCVIDLTDGGRLIRLYDRADADRLYLRGGPGGLDAETVLERSRAARVAAVIARLDP